MKECDKSKIHINSNFILSICILTILYTLLRQSLYCNTSLHFTNLHLTTLHYPLIWVNPITIRIVRFHLTSLNNTLDTKLEFRINCEIKCYFRLHRRVVLFVLSDKHNCVDFLTFC